MRITEVLKHGRENATRARCAGRQTGDYPARPAQPDYEGTRRRRDHPVCAWRLRRVLPTE